jgi:hypothetical protein
VERFRDIAYSVRYDHRRRGEMVTAQAATGLFGTCIMGGRNCRIEGHSGGRSQGKRVSQESADNYRMPLPVRGNGGLEVGSDQSVSEE